MKSVYAAILLLAGALGTSCQRTTEPAGPGYDLTGRYQAAATITAANPIRMYTAAGLVSDPAAVTRFLARRPTQAGYFSATDVPVPRNQLATLVFRAGSRATLLFTVGTRTDSIRTEVTDQQPNSFLLQHLDSTSFTSPPPGTVACNRPGELASYIRGVAPGRRYTGLVINPGGASRLYRVRPVEVVGARGSQLYIPYYSWLIQAGGCYTAVSGEWNTFGSGVLGQLTPGDTVVVQEREIALHR